MRSVNLQLPCVKTSNFLMVAMVMVGVVNMVVIVVGLGRDGTEQN